MPDDPEQPEQQEPPRPDRTPELIEAMRGLTEKINDLSVSLEKVVESMANAEQTSATLRLTIDRQTEAIEDLTEQIRGQRDGSAG